MTIKGKITEKLKIESGTSKAGKDWQKQTIILDNGDQYNPLVAISFFGDEKLSEVSKFQTGNEVEVSINLSSREFNGKWYNSIDGWKIVANADFNSAEISKQNINKQQEETSDNLPF